MYDGDEWDLIREHRERSRSKSQFALRLIALTCAGVAALALVAVPFIDGEADRRIARGSGVDPITTATVRSSSEVYTVRRSVLQPSPTDVCIIRANGTFEGRC
ncbi:MAG: hypothetical protein AAGI92_07385 [Pseudomonadota bacterium]